MKQYRQMEGKQPKDSTNKSQRQTCSRGQESHKNINLEPITWAQRTCADPSRPYARCVSPREFISMLKLSIQEALSAWGTRSPLALTFFMLPLSQSSLSTGRRDLLKTFHLGLNVPRPLTLCIEYLLWVSVFKQDISKHSVFVH